MKKLSIFIIIFILLGLVLPQLVLAQATYTALTGEINLPYVDIKGGDPYEVTFSIEDTMPDLTLSLTNAVPVVASNSSIDATFDPEDGSLKIRTLKVVVGNGLSYDLYNVFAQLDPDSNPLQFAVTGVLNSNLNGYCWDANQNDSCDDSSEDEDGDGYCTILDCKDEMIESLKENSPFVNDITLFTIYAFMNYTGYGDEPYYYMHPVREKLREELDLLSPQLEDNDYYKNLYNLDPTATKFLGGVAQRLGPAPIFRDSNHQRYGNLGAKLTEFYTEARIDFLYTKYDPSFQQEIISYENEVYPVLAKLLRYFKLQPLEIEMAVNLLAKGGFAGYTTMSIGADRKQPDAGHVIHEYTHNLELPYKDSIEAIQLSDVLEQIYGAPESVLDDDASLSYLTWSSIISESIVRASSGWFERGSEYVNHQIDRGFLLTGYFYEKIRQYDDSQAFGDWLREAFSVCTTFLENGGRFSHIENEPTNKRSIQVGVVPDSVSTSGPVLDIFLSGDSIHLSWDQVPNTDFYRLYYAPYPEMGAINFIDVPQWSDEKTSYLNQLSIDLELPAGSSYYVAVESHNNNMGSQGMTEIGYFILQ